MAGFLSALIPVAQTLGPEMQIGAREAQRQSSTDAYGKLLDQLGPEAEPFRQYFKAGGTPAEVSAAMGGEIGQELRQKHAITRMSEIMSSGTDFRQNLITAAGEGLVPWKEVLSYMKDPTKAPPVMPEDLKSSAKKWLDSGPNIDDQTRRYVQSAIDDNDYGALKEINDKVIPPYQGSTLYATRGFTMTGTDSDGVPFSRRYIEGSRGQPAHVQNVYDDGTPVPSNKMIGGSAKITGGFADSGGGGYGGGDEAGGGYSTGAPAPYVPMGGPGAGPGAPTVRPSGAGAVGGPSNIPAPSTAPATTRPGLQPLQIGHLGATEVKTVANINSLLPQLDGLQKNMTALGQDKWDRTVASRVFSKYLAQKLDVLPGTDPTNAGVAGNQAAQNFMNNDPDMQKLNIQDPDLAHVMSQIITVDAMASISLLASAGSRASNLLDKFSGHIMEPNGNYGSIMTNIQTLNATDGPYRSWLHAMRVNPSTPDPAPYVVGRGASSGGAGPGGGTKYFSPDKSQYWLNGKTYDARTGRQIGG